MAISGALISGAIGAFGSKPRVPAFKEISPDAIQASTIQGNITSLADVARLAAGVDTFNQSQLEGLIDRVLPGARQQIQENISAGLRGEIPDDVRRAIAQGNSERFAGVFAGSNFARSNEAKQLGLTSLGIMNQNLSSAESWLQFASAPRYDITQSFFTPQQRLLHAVNERDARYQRDLMAAQVKAAPDPATAALGTEIDRFFNTAAGAGMMAAGGGFGGGAGAGSGAGGLAAANQSMGVANPYNLGGYNFGGMGLAGGQGVSIGQSSMGNFYGNWNKQYGF